MYPRVLHHYRCSSVCCLFDHRVPHTELAVRWRGIGRGKSIDYQTFDDNGLETTHFRGKSASAGTSPVPSFWIRSFVLTFEKPIQSSHSAVLVRRHEDTAEESVSTKLIESETCSCMPDVLDP